MDRQRSRAHAAFGAKEGQNFSRILRTAYGDRPAMVEPGERIREFVGVERLGEKFAVPRAHGAQQQVRIGGGRERQDRDLVVKALAQTFSGLERKLRVLIEVDHRDAALGFNGPLGKRWKFGGREVVLVIHRNQRPGHMGGKLAHLLHRLRLDMHRQ